MAQATGRGKTEIRTNPASLLLFNFDIDGDALKEEHKTFLRAQALAPLKAGSAVSVVGLADRSGSSAHNKALSDRRVANTITFLQTLVPGSLKLAQASGFGEELAAREGEKDGSHDERFRSVLVFLKAPAVVTQTKAIEVAAKSFIALIGGRVGTMPGTTIVPIPVPVLPVTPLPVPVSRQSLLELLARATDAQFNENPLNSAKDRRYRLFSMCRFTVVWENGKILAAVPSPLDTDVGNEGPLQPPPLVTTPVAVSPVGGSVVTFSWTGKGRPHLLAEPAFQTVQPRTSVFIWHVVEGRIDVSSGVPVVTVGIRGSQFPSHRVFVNGTPSPPGLRQGNFSDLWVADPADKTKVR